MQINKVVREASRQSTNQDVWPRRGTDPVLLLDQVSEKNT